MFGYDNVLFVVGDLVEFIGYHYTPDYYIVDEEHESLGIVIERISTPGIYPNKSWLYRVYWFKSRKVTETVAGHLKMVTVERNKQTNYIDGVQNED
jgi:hypothetical protein